MRAEIYPISNMPRGRLAIMPRPRAGDWLAGEIDSWRQSGLDVIISLLQDCEIAELGLEQESDHCAEAGLGFIHYPIPDTPDQRAWVYRFIQKEGEAAL
jgi:hypothetical protein